jgi:hypothetical protein
MSEKEKPLPKPPGQASGRKTFHEGEDNAPLLADKIAEALAGGKLDEFIEQEIPDSEQARTLVSMMMGMTGMLPREGLREKGKKTASDPSGERTSEETPPAAEPHQDLRQAAQAGDMETLVGLLKREHGKRQEGEPDTGHEEYIGGSATIGREDIDQLIRIASDNSLSPDWIILRAVRLYIREYERTGRL